MLWALDNTLNNYITNKTYESVPPRCHTAPHFISDAKTVGLDEVRRTVLRDI